MKKRWREWKDWMKCEWEGGVPDWAWYITWGIMIAAIIVEIIGIAGRLK